jgi:membrane-associated HD superfamily phosphohydrolase
MSFEISDKEKKQARQPHELFLINLITNHILLFAAALGVATSYPLLLLPIAIASASILIYTLVRARRALVADTWFVSCHWQVAARRSRMFLIMLAAVSGIVATILLVAGGDPRPQHWAILGATVLPVMVTVLVLIILETDAMQQATHGDLPKWVRERIPQPQTEAA